MEMNQIRYFLAVCQHRNFTHAASASNVSQPSLTTAIKKLEHELGGDLFVRDRAGCRLTALGKLMQPRLQKAHDETQAAKAEAVRHTRLERVPISVGVGETIGHNRISAAVERFRTRLPQAEIELIVASASKLLAGLRERLGKALFVDALDHLTEPSIQVHLPWIQHCLGDVPVTGVLVPDPIQQMIVDDGERTSGEQFAKTLKELLNELGGRTLIICSCDLSHVGPQFGEPAVIDEERRNQVEEQDRNMLALFVEGDSAGFIEGLAWSNNPTRWCSAGSMSVALMLFGGESEIELLDYRQAYDESGTWLVSAAACAVI